LTDRDPSLHPKQHNLLTITTTIVTPTLENINIINHGYKLVQGYKHRTLHIESDYIYEVFCVQVRSGQVT